MKDCCTNQKDLNRLKKLTEMMKIVAEPNRLKIICFLSSGTKCVCEIEAKLKLKQNLVSHHLKVLKKAGFITLKKEGQWRNYSLISKNIKEFNHLFGEIFK